MEYYQFIGLMIIGLGAIVSLFFAVHTPLSKIVQRLTKIETQLETMNKTLGKHSNKLEDHEKRISNNEMDISIIKKTRKGGK